MSTLSNPLIEFLLSKRSIPPAEQELIAAAFELKSFREGEALSVPGGINRRLFFICRGVLRIVMYTDEGVEVIHFFLRENQFCTIQNSFLNEVPAPESIQAACEAEVLSVSKTGLLSLYEKLPWLQGLIDGIIQQALVDKIQLRNGYLGLDASTRYRLFLTRQPEVASRVSLLDTASYLGITRQSLSRIRRSLM